MSNYNDPFENPLVQAFAYFAKKHLSEDENYDCKQSMKKLEDINHKLKTDKLFQDIYPTVFNLIKCEFRIIKSESESTSNQ